MLETMRRLGTAATSLHRDMKEAVNAVGEFLVDVFHFLALFAIGATTVWSALGAFIGMVAHTHTHTRPGDPHGYSPLVHLS
jgi:protein PsiE